MPLWRLTKSVFMEKDFGPFTLTLASQFDSARVERYIFPALRYTTNLHHRDHDSEGLTFYTSLQLCWWAWYLSVRKYHQEVLDENVS